MREAGRGPIFSSEGGSISGARWARRLGRAGSPSQLPLAFLQKIVDRSLEVLGSLFGDFESP
jgi:hypothetical protein